MKVNASRMRFSKIQLILNKSFSIIYLIVVVLENIDKIKTLEKKKTFEEY